VLSYSSLYYQFCISYLIISILYMTANIFRMITKETKVAKCVENVKCQFVLLHGLSSFTNYLT
jgi:hypothetical protein